MVILPYLYVDMSNSSDSSGISNASLSVVNIIASNASPSAGYNIQRKQQMVGSGVIISEDGYIITNLHIINGQKQINVELDDGQVKLARVIGYDQRSDLAVIKISHLEKLSPIILADSKTVRIGDNVIAIGNSFGLGTEVF